MYIKDYNRQHRYTVRASREVDPAPESARIFVNDDQYIENGGNQDRAESNPISATLSSCSLAEIATLIQMYCLHQLYRRPTRFLSPDFLLTFSSTTVTESRLVTVLPYRDLATPR